MKLNNIFFLIIPFAISFIPLSFAETGYDYFDVVNPDGTHSWSTHEPYLFSNGQWVPYVYSNGKVDTAHISVQLNTNGTYSLYKDNNLLLSDYIVAKYADVSNLNSWTYPNTLNNDTPDNSWNGIEFKSSKLKTGVGLLDYKFLLDKGKWKTQLEATNLSALTTKAFGFDEIIDLNTDVITFGTQQRNLDNYNGTTFSKAWLIANQAKIVDFMNGLGFDFDKGFDDLYSITVYDTGVNKSRLVFDYRTDVALLPNQKLIIDPTFGYTAGVWKRYFSDLTGAITNCATEVAVGGSDFNNQGIIRTDDLGGRCQAYTFQNDISSLPSSVSVSGVNIRIDVSATSSPNGCDVFQVTNNPNTASDSTIWADIFNGSQYVSDSTECDSTGNDKIITFNSQSYTDITNLRLTASQNFTFSIVGGNWDAVVGTSETTLNLATGSVDLQINYTNTIPKPDRINDLTYTNLSANTVDLLWTQPGLNGGNLTNYLINYTSPYGTPTTFRANSTNTYLNVTGLTFGTQYSFRVSALTEGGYNATGNILNITTTSTEFAVAPVLIANSYNSTKIDLIWTAPSMNNINGYRIERETPIGTGWSTVVSNTTSTTLYYNNTGLTSNVIYNYRVYALNGSGISQASNEYDMTTFHLPDAVTTLSGTATGFATVMLTWTAPTSYAPEITGYQINYTSPTGNPTTVITNSTGDDDTEATVDNLEVGGDFSFRVAPLTIHGTNASGNIFNVTTITNYNLGNLTDPDVTNENDFKIFFDRTDVDDTTILLDVTYPTAYVMNCEFSYKYSRDSQTYGPLTHTVVNSEEDKTTFQFNNVTNDIIDARCWDTATNDTGYYIITITDFELLNQIANLQNGTYGTEGRIGGIDIVTLIVIILGMIGFNRVTPIAGVIFTCVTVGITAYFGIIETYQIMFPIIALVVLLAYIRTRQD